jgi:hypothetical protein
MPHCASLRFVDEIDCYSLPDKVSPLAFRDDARELSRFMTSPLSWGEINRLDGGAENLSAKLLWELPIAFYKAGVTLRSMSIRSFPHPYWCSVNYPVLWTDLSAACQHLNVFRLESIILISSSNPLFGIEQDFIEQYIGAALSSEVLEVIVISFRDIAGPSTLYRAGLLPGTINWPRIKRLDISHLSFSQGELEKFCSGLGYKIEDIRLCYINLRSGTWARVLDMLRKRVTKKRLNMACKYLHELIGGEFGQANRWLIQKSQDYINGVRETKNPLRGESYNS